MEGYLQLELERFLANREDVKRMKINKETFFLAVQLKLRNQINVQLRSWGMVIRG